jgi:nucleoside-diphosphate-sugar epimerase
MKLLITGADRPLGRLATDYFQTTRDLILTGQAAALNGVHANLPYQLVDLRQPDAVKPLLAGVEAILHLDIYDPQPLSGPQAEQDRLDIATRGTYVLLSEARQAGVERLILASSLAHFDAYPQDYVIDESWQPEPAPNADALAPYLGEIVCREFAREGGIRAICLRFGPLDASGGTPGNEALQALSGALALPFTKTGYRWRLFHLTTAQRFTTNAARQALTIPPP